MCRFSFRFLSFVAGTSLPTHKDQSLNTLQTMMFSNAFSSSANLACNIASFNGLQNEPQSTWKYTFDIGFCQIFMWAFRQVDWWLSLRSCFCNFLLFLVKCQLVVGSSPPHVAGQLCAEPWQKLPGFLNYFTYNPSKTKWRLLNPV